MSQTALSPSCREAASSPVVPVALRRLPPGHVAAAAQALPALLEAAGLRTACSLRSARVLVKPNLLTATPLACTSPWLVAGVCRWLLEQGAQVRVGDSPGFGTATAVARHIGLEAALRPLGLKTESLADPRPLALPLRGGGPVSFGVARAALESDLIVSLPRVKAHSQMRLTLAVKNLFGCVCGLRKALIHTRQGQEPDFFADCIAALWAALPPVAAVADGLTAMHVTGPSKGRPFPLGLLGASPSAVALDEALCAVLGLPLSGVPLGAALERRQAPGCTRAGWRPDYVLERPDAFDSAGFVIPEELMHTSFRPWRLFKSCVRRLWLARRK